MKCSNPNCNRGIGLVRYRRGWFSKQRYCSKNCCDAFVADVPKQQQKPQCSVLLRVACFTTDWEFATKIDARNHPHKNAVFR
jgi:hypothetical protein